MPDTQAIPPALRAELDRELSAAIDGLLHEAAKHDGEDLIEANAALTFYLMDMLSPTQLAAAAAALALRLHRGSTR